MLRRELVSTQSTYAREHVSMQGTLACELVSTQGTLTRKHVRHIGTQAPFQHAVPAIQQTRSNTRRFINIYNKLHPTRQRGVLSASISELNDFSYFTKTIFAISRIDVSWYYPNLLKKLSVRTFLMSLLQFSFINFQLFFKLSFSVLNSIPCLLFWTQW